MRHLLQIISLSLLVSCWPTSAFAQNPGPDLSEVMRQLLSMPAPTPRTAAPADAEPKKQRSPQFFDKDKAPPDDAPIEDLLEYWNRWVDRSDRPVPSDAVKQKVLDACVDTLESLPRFLPLFSSSEATAAKVKELFDKGQSDQKLDEDWRTKVKKWLVFNSKYFLSDLMALANRVKDNKGGYVDNEEALVALARVDWGAAEPLLQSVAGGGQPRSSALALVLLYKQAISSKDVDAEEKHRARLKIIASDRNAPAHSRDTAIEALSITDWSGRDDWYISLLADDSLRECSDGSYGFNPLTTLFDRDPEKWIPVMARLVESKDRAVQQAAASCLVIYATAHPRRDAILPVLRWLSDPDWLHISSTQRAWFMQKMDELEMPESVPGLIWIVENEKANRQWAARTLAHYKDQRAVPALMKALTEGHEGERQYILDGLLASGGISEPEGVNALEAYAIKLATSEGREEMGRYRSSGDAPLPIPLSIGMYLAGRKDVPEALVRAVLARATSLQKRNPTVAQALLEVAQQWQSAQVDLDMIRRIANGSADAKTIANALGRRTKLQENLRAELQALLSLNGPAQGIGAVLLEDHVSAQNVLGSENQPAQIALLACARLTRTPLSVRPVAAMMQSKNPLMALAAERYLLVEDSKEARQFLWHRHPNEAYVTGWRENLEFIGGDLALMGKLEEKLRGELFKENSPVEIFALIANHNEYGRILRVYSDKAIYTHYVDSARYRERVVPKAEVSNFKLFVATNGIADLGPQFDYCHHNCWSSEFLMLTKEQGRRVFSHQGFEGWASLVASFDLLGRGEGAEIHYNLEKEIKGLEVLYADEKLVVKDVWVQGGGIKIFVERTETQEEIEERRRSENSVDEDDEAARADQRRREAERFTARFSWRLLANRKAGAVTSQPEGYSTIDASKFLSDDDDDDEPRRDDRQMQMITPESVIIARNFDGLWKQLAGGKAVRISDKGAYATPIVTPDGKWVVVAKTDSDWGKPNYVVRFNLQTGRELRANIPPAEEFDPIAYLAVHGKVLLRRAKDEYDQDQSKSVGPDRPEYYLLDAATGESKLVSGEFAPLRQEGKRFLQPTDKPNEFWVAIPDREKNETRVGRYNLRDFSFQSLLLVPQISFDSMQMWVDQAGTKLYVIYEGNLLRLPLPAR